MLPFILFIASTCLPGLVMISFFKSRPWLLAYGIGTALISFELFLYFVILRLPFDNFLFWFFGIQALISLVILIIRLPWREKILLRIKLKPLTWILSLLIVFFLFLSLVQALGKPPVAFDAVAFWAIRAEILIHDNQVDFNPASPTYLSAFSHHNYPWHLSFMEYWFRQLGGSGGTLHLIAWFYFLSLVLLVGNFLVKRLGQIKGLLLVLFLCSQPFIFYHASNNYADLIIGYYAAVAFTFFFSWLETKRLDYLLLAVAFFGWTLNIKNYGIFYIIALGAGLALAWLLKVYRPTLKKFIYTILAFALPLLPYGLFKIIYRLNLHNSDASWGWHPEIFSPLWQSLFTSNSWNIWWAIFIVLALVSLPKIKKHKELIVAWFMFATVVAIIVVIFIVTENYKWALDHTALSRAFIPLVPLSMILIGFSLKQHDRLSSHN